MDPTNGDAELALDGNVDHAEEEDTLARSPTYWEEVDQEEIERERRYAEFTRFNHPLNRTSSFNRVIFSV